MVIAERLLANLRHLERLAGGTSPLHRLDPRAKIVTTFVFIICVASLGRYELAALIPFSLFPFVLAASGGLPARSLLVQIAPALPFVLLVGIFNPLLDREIQAVIGPLQISGGWLSYVSLVLRTFLTVGAALILISLTGLPALCNGLQQLRLPRVFILQLLFLYRYLFVLSEEAVRLARAREQRSFCGNGRGISTFVPLAGHLLLRSWERAERIYQAMLSRGFNQEMPFRASSGFNAADLRFLAGWSLLLILIRLGDPAHRLGDLICRGLQ